MNILTINLALSTLVFWIAAKLYVLPKLQDYEARAILLPILLLHSLRHLGRPLRDRRKAVFLSHSHRPGCPLLAQSGHSCSGAIRKRSLPVIGSRGHPLPALRTATPPCCAVCGPSPQRHRRVRGRTRTKSGSRMALQVLGCDAAVSLRPAGIPYQFQCAEIAPRRWLGVHLALSPTKLLSSGSE